MLHHEFRQSAALAIARAGDAHQIIFRTNGATTTLLTQAGASVRLRVHVADGGECTFAYATDDGKFTPVEETFQAQPGVWIGARVGIYSTRTAATGGHADFDYFCFGRVVS